jgi:hypothetical protein
MGDTFLNILRLSVPLTRIEAEACKVNDHLRG